MPELRFPEFSDGWESTKFADLFEFLSNNTLSRADLSDSGTVKNIHYGDVLIKFGDVVSAKDNTIPFIKDKAQLSKNTDYLKNGDIIIADTAEDDTVGKATEIQNISNESVVSGLHTIPCRAKERFASGFLGYYLNSSAYHSQLYPLMQGIKVTSISKGNISKTELKFPCVNEQGKIACMLSLIDKKIEAQKQMIDSLKLYKRGLINQIFENKLSFLKKSEWHKYQLSDILKERKTYCEKDGTYEHATLSKEGVYGKTDRYDRDYLVSSDDKKYKITKLGDICYNPANLKFGVICLNTYGDAIFSPIYITFEVNKKFSKDDFINKALQYQQGTVYERMAVSPEDLLSMSINLPPKDIQDSLAKVILKIEDKVSKTEMKLTELKQMRTALLQKMFI